MTIPQWILWGWVVAIVIAIAQPFHPVIENLQTLIVIGQDAWHTHQPHELD